MLSSLAAALPRQASCCPLLIPVPSGAEVRRGLGAAWGAQDAPRARSAPRLNSAPLTLFISSSTRCQPPAEERNGTHAPGLRPRGGGHEPPESIRDEGEPEMQVTRSFLFHYKNNFQGGGVPAVRGCLSTPPRGHAALEEVCVNW